MVHHSDFRQADVFTTTPFKRAPVAQVIDATGLTDVQTQRRIALTEPE